VSLLVAHFCHGTPRGQCPKLGDERTSIRQLDSDVFDPEPTLATPLAVARRNSGCGIIRPMTLGEEQSTETAEIPINTGRGCDRAVTSRPCGEAVSDRDCASVASNIANERS
jgi:hypothetical protein